MDEKHCTCESEVVLIVNCMQLSVDISYDGSVNG